MSNYGFAGTGQLSIPPLAAAYLGRAYEFSLTPTAVAGVSFSEQTFTGTGLRTWDNVHVQKPTVQSGLFIVQAYVSASDVLNIVFQNVSVSQITPTAETYKVIAFKTA